MPEVRRASATTTKTIAIAATFVSGAPSPALSLTPTLLAGVYRSRDARATWEHVGFRDSRGISKIRIQPTNPARSTDGGTTWELVNDERRIRQRAYYHRSTDDGATYEVITNGTHGDLVVANDGGGAVRFTTGSESTDQEFSTAQFYHGVTTAHSPWHICGSQQEQHPVPAVRLESARIASASADGEEELELGLSFGIPYYERDLLNVIRQGRGVPVVRLVQIGIVP